MSHSKRNVRGGKGFKKTSKGMATAVREFVEPTAELIPAMVTALTGAKDIRVKYIYKEKERENLVTMPGIWRKRRIHPRVGDIILFTMHDFIKTVEMDAAVGIGVHMYRPDEHSELYRGKHIPERWKITERGGHSSDDVAAPSIDGYSGTDATSTVAAAAPAPAPIAAFTFEATNFNIDDI